MSSAWQEFRAGWREARWSTYFALYLVPLLLVALLLARVLPWGWSGGVSQAPGPVGYVLISAASLVAFILAARRDGPEGWLGRHLYWLLDLPHLADAEYGMERFVWSYQHDASLEVLAYHLGATRASIQYIQVHSPRYSVLLQAINQAEYLLRKRREHDSRAVEEEAERSTAG